jgi:hypothetical protein
MSGRITRMVVMVLLRPARTADLPVLIHQTHRESLSAARALLISVLTLLRMRVQLFKGLRITAEMARDFLD